MSQMPPAPSAMPDAGAEQRQARGFGQEQREDLPVARADGLQQADLRRALAHGDEHDVHDQHARDDEADRGDRREARRDHVEDRVERGDQARLASRP